MSKEIWTEITRDFELFHAEGAMPFATVTLPGGGTEHMPVRAPGFADILRLRYLDRTGEAPTEHALRRQIATLASVARFRGPLRDVHVRVGHGTDGSIYVDRGPEADSYVRIFEDGWEIVPSSPVRFWRPIGMSTLPEPVTGSLQALRPFVHVKREDDFRLVIGYMIDFFRAAPPHYVLIVQGRQGSGKSTLARVVGRALHPENLDTREPPESDRDLLIAAQSSPVVIIDNLSMIPKPLSDVLCRLATGTGQSVRELYTAFGEARIRAGFPSILTGIGDLATQDDLRERAIIIDLPKVETRLTEATFWSDFNTALPQILGGLYTGVSGALTRRINDRSLALPRMADGAAWVTAAEPTLGWADGSYLAAFQHNQSEAIEIVLEYDPVAPLIRSFVGDERTWIGTATDLLQVLRRARPAELGHDPEWPRSPAELSKRLERIAPALSESGIELRRWRESGGDRTRMIGISADRFESMAAAKQRRSARFEKRTPGVEASGAGVRAGPRPVEGGVRRV